MNRAGGLLKISDAAVLAFHAVYLLVQDTTRQHSIQEMAKQLSVSSAHLAKVLQTLCHVGIVQSIRGPKGGFLLTPEATQFTLLNVYEAIHGPVRQTACLLGKPVCIGGCMLGGLLAKVDRDVMEQLGKVHLKDLREK